jgi:lysophospholipase L1-like esterase
MYNHTIYIKFIALFFFISACSSQDMDTFTDPNLEDGMSYLALGDSYTIGQGVDEQARWPNQLKDSLLVYDKNLSKVDIIAKTGWTTNNLIKAIEAENPDKYDLVSLLIGVNNQYQKLNFNQFKIEFDSLLTIADNLTIKYNRLFVVSIPDYGVTPFGANNSEIIGQEIDKYNSYMKITCQDLGIPFVNITEISRELGDSSIALAPDKLHPSGYQYRLWVKEILPIVKKLLE